jgi:hypothetical protein
MNPKLGGDAWVIDEFLVFHHIVGHVKVQPNHVEEPISLRRGQHYASPSPVERKRAIKIHALVLLGNGGWGLLSLGPFSQEICQSLGLDHHLWDVGYVKPHELESSLGNPPRSETISDNFPEPI